jgi:hypothetical protein
VGWRLDVFSDASVPPAGVRLWDFGVAYPDAAGSSSPRPTHPDHDAPTAAHGAAAEHGSARHTGREGRANPHINISQLSTISCIPATHFPPVRRRNSVVPRADTSKRLPRKPAWKTHGSTPRPRARWPMKIPWRLPNEAGEVRGRRTGEARQGAIRVFSTDMHPSRSRRSVPADDVSHPHPAKGIPVTHPWIAADVVLALPAL